MKAKLSPRQLVLLRGMSRGLTNQEIAVLAGVRLQTVKNTNLRMFRKLDVRNRTEAVIKATQLGLIELDFKDVKGWKYKNSNIYYNKS